MKETEMKQIAQFIKTVHDNYANEEKLAEIKEQVRLLTAKFPLYRDMI